MNNKLRIILEIILVIILAISVFGIYALDIYHIVQGKNIWSWILSLIVDTGLFITLILNIANKHDKK